MKKIIAILAGALLLAFTLSGFAATDLKIGVVDTVSILAKSPRFAQTQKELQDSFAASQAKVNKVQDDFRAEYGQLQQSDVAKMSTIKRKQLQAKVNQDKDNLLKLSQELSAKEQKNQQVAMQKVATALNEAIAKVAQEQGLNLVLTKQAAVYAEPTFDITPQVAKIFG